MKKALNIFLIIVTCLLFLVAYCIGNLAKSINGPQFPSLPAPETIQDILKSLKQPDPPKPSAVKTLSSGQFPGLTRGAVKSTTAGHFFSESEVMPNVREISPTGQYDIRQFNPSGNGIDPKEIDAKELLEEPAPDFGADPLDFSYDVPPIILTPLNYNCEVITVPEPRYFIILGLFVLAAAWLNKNRI